MMEPATARWAILAVVVFLSINALFVSPPVGVAMLVGAAVWFSPGRLGMRRASRSIGERIDKFADMDHPRQLSGNRRFWA